jgi:DNA-binding GntR family transcriptional regulator
MTDGTDMDDPTKYKRLTAYIRAQIEDGIIPPGEPVPSVTELAAENNWSRQTCARALQKLEAEGLLTRYLGLGYYVTGTSRQPDKL